MVFETLHPTGAQSVGALNKNRASGFLFIKRSPRRGMIFESHWGHTIIRASGFLFIKHSSPRGDSIRNSLGALQGLLKSRFSLRSSHFGKCNKNRSHSFLAPVFRQTGNHSKSGFNPTISCSCSSVVSLASGCSIK